MTSQPKALTVETTTIPGLLIVSLPVHGDNRGWFKENWQRSKMVALGLPDFTPIQNNVSFNAQVGTTRGIHAEPWDKYVSVATGRAYGAWVDLREGPAFGTVVTAELDPSVAVFVPRGVGNSFQTLEPNTAYSYLVNAHWSPEAQEQYTFLNLADPTCAIEWPVPLAAAELSDKDRAHPVLSDIAPVPRAGTLVLGASGQLGTALRRVLPHACFADRSAVDLADPASLGTVPWSSFDTVVNAAAYTRVDEAETPHGRRQAWAINARGVAELARIAAEHQLTLVHVSSDYVFDGGKAVYTEEDEVCPLGVYGQSKAAGDAAVSTVPRHYLVRTSWVIGEGGNFVRTMAGLADRGVNPRVVDDQTGRLSFTQDLAEGIAHLLSIRPAYGTYNLTNGGDPMTWADIARRVFTAVGRPSEAVSGVSTEEYFADREAAPRPLNSTLDLSRITATGFAPRKAEDALTEYLRELRQNR